MALAGEWGRTMADQEQVQPGEPQFEYWRGQVDTRLATMTGEIRQLASAVDSLVRWQQRMIGMSVAIGAVVGAVAGGLMHLLLEAVGSV